MHLEEFEDDSAVGGHHFEELVEVVSVGRLTVGGTQGERQEVQHGRDDQRSRVVHLSTETERRKCFI